MILYGLIAFGLVSWPGSQTRHRPVRAGRRSMRVGMVGFHVLISRTSVSTAVSLTGLYPASPPSWPSSSCGGRHLAKVLGIALSMVAVYLLSS